MAVGSGDADQLWAPWRDGPDRAGILLDFDGTVSAIVSDPWDARLLPGADETLAALAARYRLVAIVSGRPAVFLAAHVQVPGVQRWGAYGLEHVTANGHVIIDADAAAWRPQVSSVIAAAQRAAPPGVYVEDKGISATLHVRNAPGQEAWMHDFANDQAVRTGLVVHAGKRSAELRPPIDVDKGTIVSRLVGEAGLRAACFVGDDVGDMSAFRALHTVEVAVRVAVRSSESPGELLDAADVIVDGPSGALALLRTLVDP